MTRIGEGVVAVNLFGIRTNVTDAVGAGIAVSAAGVVNVYETTGSLPVEKAVSNRLEFCQLAAQGRDYARCTGVEHGDDLRWIDHFECSRWWHRRFGQVPSDRFRNAGHECRTATAVSGIYLEEKTGDLRAQSIVSSTGDVGIKVLAVR